MNETEYDPRDYLVCPTCYSKGFEISILENRCTFCDGTEGGNPPDKGDSDEPTT